MAHPEPFLLRAQPGVPSAAPLGEFLDLSARTVASLGLASSLDRAAAAGAMARCVGHAFVAGYREALGVLAPTDPPVFSVLCATEEGGAHPRAIRSRLEPVEGGWLLSGEKRWSTAAGGATRLLVVASEGVDEQGRNRLAVVAVDAAAPGVSLRPMPPTPFTPEILHFGVSLDRVRVAAGDRLPGDGYERYLKPFRTLEDLHVHAALLGYLLGECARLSLGDGARAELLALLAALRAASTEPQAPASHLALEGALRLARLAIARLDEPWRAADAGGFERWQRDRPLLEIAGKARAARAEAALRALAG